MKTFLSLILFLIPFAASALELDLKLAKDTLEYGETLKYEVVYKNETNKESTILKPVRSTDIVSHNIQITRIEEGKAPVALSRYTGFGNDTFLHPQESDYVSLLPGATLTLNEKVISGDYGVIKPGTYEVRAIYQISAFHSDYKHEKLDAMLGGEIKKEWSSAPIRFTVKPFSPEVDSFLQQVSQLSSFHKKIEELLEERIKNDDYNEDTSFGIPKAPVLEALDRVLNHPAVITKKEKTNEFPDDTFKHIGVEGPKLAVESTYLYVKIYIHLRKDEVLLVATEIQVRNR